MARGSLVAAAAAVLWVVAVGAARAEKVTLANGDVLHGEVTEADGRVRIQHALLGTLSVAKADVLWIEREGEGARASGDPCVEKEAAKEACPRPWDLALGVGVSNEAGNTEKLKLNFDVDAAYRWRRNELRWRASAYYEEASGEQTEGKYFSNLGYGRQISPRGRLTGRWLVDRDDFADILLRNGWFVGYEYAFIQRKRTTLAAGLAGGAVVEKRKDQVQTETAALLAHARFRHEFAGGDSVEGLCYVIPYLDQTELSPARLDLRYVHPLRAHFDLTAGFLADYVPDPPGDIESLDTKITLGIRWRP